MGIWTDEDENAARVLSRVWRWRIYGLISVAIAAVVVALLLKG